MDKNEWKRNHKKLADNVMGYGSNALVPYLDKFKDLDNIALPEGWKIRKLEHEPPFYEIIRAWNDKEIIVHDSDTMWFVSFLLLLWNDDVRYFMETFSDKWCTTQRKNHVGMWKIYEQVFMYGMITEDDELRGYGILLLEDQDLYDRIVDTDEVFKLTPKAVVDAPISVALPKKYFYISSYSELKNVATWISKNY